MRNLFYTVFLAFCLSNFVFSQDYKNWVRFAPRLSDIYFTSDSARLVAANVMAHQIENGAWPKNINFFHVDIQNDIPTAIDSLSRLPRQHDLQEATIDNGATMTEIRFLMRMYEAVKDSAYLESAVRGVNYLLSMQYANGGFPQYFPRHDHYHGRITFNDNAMTNALRLLLQLSRREAPYTHLPLTLSVEASAAVDKGVECILACQYVQHGKRTIWAQQYDEKTLQPVGARAFELAGLATSESVAVVEFLQLVENGYPEVKEAIAAAVRWFGENRLEDGRWARFYTLDDNRPFFCGRDGVMRFSLDEIEEERRNGYSWYNTQASKFLERKFSGNTQIQ